MHRLLLLALCAVVLPAQTETDFLRGHTDFRDIDQMLRGELNRRGLELLDAREQRIAQLKTTEQVRQRQQYVRETILDMIGGLPERTPLNPRVTGVIDHPGFRIEKIVFESQPGFHVTANLYVPTSGPGPFPAVLYPLGHEAGGKSYPVWQQMLGALASKGYVALTWDPLGQGERVQLWDPDLGTSKVRSSTVEHTILGIQSILTGQGVARHTIWDGIRALDYLLSRPEVDAAKIACTGNSGGGTHTAYLTALDDRIHVAAPSCYLTSWRRLLVTIGPQDAEQNMLPFLAKGLDHGDFVLAFAPKPYHMLSAIRDFFSIQGARMTFREVRDIYEIFDARGRAGMTEADDGHGYSAPRRAAAYRFFAEWLQGTSDTGDEPSIPISTARELWATQTGQVATSLDGRNVHDLIVERLDSILANGRGLPDRASPDFKAEIARRVKSRTRFSPPEGPVEQESYGWIERAGYRIEKLTYRTEPGILVPALLYIPEGGPARKPAVIFVDARGKSAEAQPGAAQEELALTGRVVLVPDLRGWGETGGAGPRTGSAFENWFGSYDTVMTSFLIDQPLVGQRMADISRGLDLLLDRDDVDAARIEGVGHGAGAVPLLHLAAADDRLAAVELHELLESYESVVRSRLHQRLFESVVPGVLESYDLVDLAAAVGPGTVQIESTVNAMGVVVGRAGVGP